MFNNNNGDNDGRQTSGFNRGRFYNNYSRPYFGPREDYNNRNDRRNNYGYERRYDRGYDHGPRYPNDRFNQNNYDREMNYYNNRRDQYNYQENNENDEEKEKLEDEKNLKAKYDSFIDKIENAFFGLVTKEEIFNIIKSLIKMPSLTIFEAMNFIYREVKIYQSLTYYKTNSDKSASVDGDIFENKYPEEYVTNNFNDIIEKYKRNKNDESNDNKENSYYLYEDEIADKRREITKNKDGIYNYLPIMKDNIININEEEKKRFENLSIFANNENEINFHPLFYKTLICNFCKNDEDKNYLIEPLCPYSHDIQKEFRIIYDYKDRSICELMKALSNSNLFTFENYLKYIPKKLHFEKKDLINFKVHKCLLDKDCPNDYHLCPFYHESKGDAARRPPLLFRYSSEICEYCFDKNQKRYIVENCPYGDFCNNIHNKNEYNYHEDHFRKKYKCTRNPKGKCPFIKTCYGMHNSDEENGDESEENNDEKEEENEEEKEINTDEENLEDEEIAEKKEKIEKIIKISKNFRCRMCNSLKPDICFFLDCNHFLCLSCFKKYNNNLKKAKKEKKNEKGLICPFCSKELVKGKLIKYLFAKN